MFEIYDKINKIPLKKAKEINKFMVDNYCNRKEYLNRPRSDFENDDMFNKWLHMIQNEDNYYTLIYYQDNLPVAFTSYAYMDRGLCLCEVQIKEEYQGKFDILRKMLKYIIDNTDHSKYSIVCGGINNNSLSASIFTHIGMKNTEKSWYEISLDDLEKWVNKE